VDYLVRISDSDLLRHSFSRVQASFPDVFVVRLLFENIFAANPATSEAEVALGLDAFAGCLLLDEATRTYARKKEMERTLMSYFRNTNLRLRAISAVAALSVDRDAPASLVTAEGLALFIELVRDPAVDEPSKLALSYLAAHLIRTQAVELSMLSALPHAEFLRQVTYQESETTLRAWLKEIVASPQSQPVTAPSASSNGGESPGSNA